MSSARHTLLPVLLYFGTLVLAGCQFHPPDPNKDDTPTSGRAVILVDADAEPVIREEAAVFSANYPKAQLVVHYLGERELLRAMLDDSVRCAVVSAAPGGAQQAWFDQNRLSAPVVPIYTGAIAVVVNKESPMQRMDLSALRTLLDPDTAAVQAATDMPSGTGFQHLQALFAGRGSGVARSLADSLRLEGVRGQALLDVQAVIAQVATDPRAIGFIPFAAISDLDNPAMKAMRERVKLLPVARTMEAPACLPSQASLADGRYPLRRTMNMVLIEGKSGLGTGFVSFVANHKGQRIILKLGVAPIAVPARNVEVVHEPIPNP